MQGRRQKRAFSYGRLRLFFNAVILILSVSLMLIIVLVWRTFDYLVILGYLVSILVSSLGLYFMKVALREVYLSDTFEPVESQQPSSGLMRKQTFLLLVVLLSILATPLIILFFFPRLGLVILNGIVAGAAVSDLLLYFLEK